MSAPTSAQVDGLIRQRLAADPGFRGKLVSDPRGAVSEVIGMPMPEAVKVSVHEESLMDVHVVIPASQPKGQIGDADLELVAGGAVCWGHCGDVPPH